MGVEPTPVERHLKRRDAPDVSDVSRSSAQRARSLEAYIQAGNPPRWMERLAEIDHGTRRHRAALERVYALLAEECGDDREAFARRWRERAASWSFDEVNLLIRQHNEWYPIERRLPVNPRTGEYVRIHGRDYRRSALDAAWVLEQFPTERR